MSLTEIRMDEDEDVMYNSLCSLANPKPASRKRMQKQSSASPLLCRNESKCLTFVLNECLSTNGAGPIVVLCDDKSNSKRRLYNKTIKSIGTSLKNCDQSDMISIDIEGESTRLPLMCKSLYLYFNVWKFCCDLKI